MQGDLPTAQITLFDVIIRKISGPVFYKQSQSQQYNRNYSDEGLHEFFPRDLYYGYGSPFCTKEPVPSGALSPSKKQIYFRIVVFVQNNITAAKLGFIDIIIRQGINRIFYYQDAILRFAENMVSIKR